MMAMRSLGWPVAMLVMLAGGETHAGNDEEARTRFDHGMRAYNIQEFRVALNDFTRAYIEHPDPVFLFNIGQAQRQLGMYAAAAKSYRIYLANQPDAPNRAQVARLLEQMDAAAAKEQRDKAAAAPPAAVVAPSPAPPAVYFRARPRRPWYKAPAPWALAALGIASGAASAALLGVASVEGDRARRAVALADFDIHHGNDLTYQKAGWPLLAVGATSVVVAGILFAVDARKR